MKEWSITVEFRNAIFKKLMGEKASLGDWFLLQSELALQKPVVCSKTMYSKHHSRHAVVKDMFYSGLRRNANLQGQGT